MNTSINLKNLLHRIWEVKQGINEIYDWVKHGLGDDAEYIRDWADLNRVQRDGTDAEEIEGDGLFEDVLKFIWRTGKDYIWNRHGQRFRITPFKSGTTEDGGFIFYYGEKHSLVSFSGVVRDAVDTDSDIWESAVARMFGIADGYVSAMKDSLRNEENLKKAVQDGRLSKVLADQPAPDAEPAPDLKWKDGYSVDPAEAVKDPDGADGTLACADPEPCPDEVPVVDQAEEQKAEYERWKEKRLKEADPQPVCGAPTDTICEYCTTQMYCTLPSDEDCEYRETPCTKPKKNLIRAGGGPLPDGNIDMTDEQKEEYRRWKEKRLAEEDPKWKQSVESPQRYG